MKKNSFGRPLVHLVIYLVSANIALCEKVNNPLVSMHIASCEESLQTRDLEKAEFYLWLIGSRISPDVFTKEGDVEYWGNFNELSKECAEGVLGDGAVFFPRLFRFDLPENANAELKKIADEDAAREDRDQAMKELFEFQAETEAAEQQRQQERMDELAIKVYKNCLKLAQRDEVKAFTSPLCVKSFAEFGGPS